MGLASYLLIGFWFKKPSASAAAMKAFIVNRVGDFGFVLGISGVFVLFGSINFETIFASAATYLPAEGAADAHNAVINLFGMQLDKAHAITGVCLLLFMGAMGKSAQFCCTPGFGMPWKARPRFRLLSMPRPWLRRRLPGRAHVADLRTVAGCI